MRTKTAKWPLVIVMILLAICIVGAATAAVFLARKPQAAAATNALVFTFTQEKAPGWWSSGNHNPGAEAKGGHTSEGPAIELPLASMSVHHGSEDAPMPDNCFVTYNYYNSRLKSIAAAYKEYESQKVAGTKDALFQMVKESSETLTTPEGKLPFQLRQYHLKVNTGNYLEGNAVGFIAMKNGYVRIDSVCKSSQQLAATLPVLAAVQLKPAQ